MDGSLTKIESNLYLEVLVNTSNVLNVKGEQMMRLSIETFIMRVEFDDRTAFKMIKQAGFDCFDYSMYATWDEKDMLGADYKERALSLRREADKLNLECNQAHAPFDMTYKNAFQTSDEKFLRLVRSMEVASIMGAKNIIVHAIKDNLPENIDFYEWNRKFYLSLVPFCEKFNVCVSVENLYNKDRETMIPIFGNPREHLQFVKELDSKWLNICVDVGHAAITGYAPEETIALMDNSLLKALHMHDTDLMTDGHWLPYCGEQKWEKIIEALAKIQYEGDFTFEVAGFLQKLPPELLQDGLNFAEKIGRKLISDFNDRKRMLSLDTTL